jgi:acyl-coenzyme A synthetase/AMP-(fatty) acid ligase
VSGDIKHHSRYNDWLNSGDIGYIDDFGELNIVGRADDVIIINSHKIYPNDIERQIIKTADVDECVVVKVDNNGMSHLGCLYVGKDNQVSIRRKLKDVLLPFEIPKLLVAINVLPRNSNGKICSEQVRSYLNHIRG